LIPVGARGAAEVMFPRLEGDRPVNSRRNVLAGLGTLARSAA